MYSYDTSAPRILDPDDNLMNKFQATLQAHLRRVENSLSEEVHQLEVSIKQAEKKLESESVVLYQTQQDVERQQGTIEQYKMMLAQVTTLRDKKSHAVDDAKEFHKKAQLKLQEEKQREEKLSRNLEKLLALHSRFSEWESDLNDYLIISKRISERDGNKEKELIDRKQQRDCILSQLEERIWGIEAEVAYLDKQLQIKDREKTNANRIIIDTSTDLETLHREHKDLCDTWNSTVASISKRNVIYDQLQLERDETHKSYKELILGLEKVKKETNKEVEVNEHLTSVSFKLDLNLDVVSKLLSTENEKIANIEAGLIKFSKLKEQAENNYNALYIKYQNYCHREELLNIELRNATNRKHSLEETIFTKLQDKMISNKAAQYISELLTNSKAAAREHELLVTRAENLYGNSLLELEKLLNSITDEKAELQEVSGRNVEKEKEMNGLRKQVQKYETTMNRKQRKVLGLNKLIEQILASIGGEELSPQDLKVISLERNIDDIQQSIQKAQQFWIRQQGFMVSLSQQRDMQLQELNLLNKEITIMEQKKLKLNHALARFAKEETNLCKLLSSLKQKLLHMNSKLAASKDLKEELEDKRYVLKNEYVLAFQELEFKLVRLQGALRNLDGEKVTLKEELRAAQEESLSWEKKVQVAQETIKRLKEERSTGGIASMKCEIHKMEMRLSHLRRVQEKLVNDMQFCVTRRDVMMDKIIGKLKKTPKEQHNKKVVIRKRLSDRKAKIKLLMRGVKEIENTIQGLLSHMKDVQNKLMDHQEVSQTLQEDILSAEKQIQDKEIIKSHNLRSLVLKQRKANLFCEVKSGKYKSIFKSETIIEENLEKQTVHLRYLKDVLERADTDFPMLKSDISKIFLILQIL